MPRLLISYLSNKDIINLITVLKLTRNYILNYFKDIYHLSNGFTSDVHWFSMLERIARGLTLEVSNSTFSDDNFFNYHFDCEECFFGLIKQLRHLSLSSVCLHFLGCVRSCEKVWGLNFVQEFVTIILLVEMLLTT